jgi:hypothetical protein
LKRGEFKLREIDVILVEKAINKAKRQSDDYNLRRYKRMKGKYLAAMEQCDLEYYLFGHRTKDATIEELRELP